MKLSYKIFCATLALLCGVGAMAQQQGDFYASQREGWAQKAEASKPSLTKTVYRPVGLVESVYDDAAFQNWRMVPTEPMEALYGVSLKEKPVSIVDFGRHMTGYYTFRLKTTHRTQDAPMRIRFTFAEVPSELNTPLDPYKGTLSRAWVQDETLTIEQIDCDITIPRRLAGRYMKIELLGASPDFDFRMEDMWFTAQSSADHATLLPLPEGASEEIRAISEVAIETLHECMQTVYEDGPKRDMRLWIGDLYLEQLANIYSFRQHDLTKRCLYLLASLAAEDGRLHANVFERPEPHPQYGSHALDYSLIYNVALLEYLKATNDYDTARDLWVVAKRQIDDAKGYLTDDYIFDAARYGEPIWLVFDWRDGYDRSASIQGLMIWALENSSELADMLGNAAEAKEWRKLAATMRKAARKHLYDKKQGVMLSGPDGQISYLSQVWAILSDILNEKEGQRALNTVFAMDDVIYPGAPYAYHYLIEACVKCGLHEEARNRLVEYWGGMVERGADTFWEVYDPENEALSPYNFFVINSYCHAWSCTPIYFIQKYPQIFCE